MGRSCSLLGLQHSALNELGSVIMPWGALTGCGAGPITSVHALLWVTARMHRAAPLVTEAGAELPGCVLEQK